MASSCTQGSCTTVLNNDRSSLEWGRDYREDPVWQWSRHSKGKRGLTADIHVWFLIILSHMLIVATPSHPHTSPFLYPHLHRTPAPPSLLHIPKCSPFSLPAFSLSCFTDLHLPKPLSNKNKNVWNLQGVSWQAVSHSSLVTQPFSSSLYSCVVNPSFACTHPRPMFLLYFQVVNSSRQRPSAPSLCNQSDHSMH